MHHPPNVHIYVCEHISVVCFCAQLLATVLSQSVKAKEHLLEQSQSVEQSASKGATSPKKIWSLTETDFPCSSVTAVPVAAD